MAMQILSHSYRMIVANLSVALRLALLPWLVLTIGKYVMNIFAYGQLMPTFDQLADPTYASTGIGVPNFILGVATVICYIWIIVGWHRYILIEEEPRGLWPNWHGGSNMSYFIRAIFIGLALIIPAIILGIAGTVFLGAEGMGMGLHGPNPTGWIIYILFASVVITFLSFRFSLGLPAAALEKHIGVFDSWAETAEHSNDMLTLAVILSMISMGLTFLQQALIGIGPAVIAIDAVNGLFMLLNVSVLTTFYGVIVEKRSL